VVLRTIDFKGGGGIACNVGCARRARTSKKEISAFDIQPQKSTAGVWVWGGLEWCGHTVLPAFGAAPITAKPFMGPTYCAHH